MRQRPPMDPAVALCTLGIPAGMAQIAGLLRSAKSVDDAQKKIEKFKKEVVKPRWRKLILKNHPDKGGDREKFQKIQAAYEFLLTLRVEAPRPRPVYVHYFYGGGPTTSSTSYPSSSTSFYY